MTNSKTKSVMKCTLKYVLLLILIGIVLLYIHYTFWGGFATVTTKADPVVENPQTLSGIQFEVDPDTLINTTPTSTLIQGPTDRLKEIISVDVPQLDPNTLSEILISARRYSEEYDLPLTLILAIINRESTFNPVAVSKAGARGLMQIMTSIHKEKLEEMGINAYQATHIDNNIRLGCWILRDYYEETGSMEEALKKYVGSDNSPYLMDILVGYLNMNVELMEE